MGMNIQYLKYNEKHNTARMRYRDNGHTDSIKWLFDKPSTHKDYQKAEFGANLSLLLAENFLDDVSSMTKQARQELERIQPIIQAKVQTVG